jgi:hypothetical protein
MKRSAIVVAAVVLSGMGCAADDGSDDDEDEYSFSSKKYAIRLKISVHPAYRGSPLRLYDHSRGNNDICSALTGGSAACSSRFVGAVTTVLYSFRLKNGRCPRDEILREFVQDIAHSPELSARPSFSKKERIRQGLASDIHVFGYDEAVIEPAARASERAATTLVWRLLRQELFVGDEDRPFATIDWRHTIEAITVVRVVAGRE